MSFASQKISAKSEVTVIGSRWTASVMGYALLSLGHRPKIFIIDDPSQSEPSDVAVHVGNGECYENARLIFGEPVAQALWHLSGESFRKLRALLTKLSVPVRDGKALWFASDERQKALLEETARRNPVATVLKGPEWLRQGGRKFETAIAEPALLLNLGALSTALLNKFVERDVSVIHVDKLVSFEKHHLMEYRLNFEKAGKTELATTSVVLLMSDRISPELFPSMRGKWMPVTLGSFNFKAKTHKEFVLSLFNGGADFAVRGSAGLRVGSYRNLYQDKALGILTEADPATLNGVTDFFSSLNWVSAEPPVKTHLSAESLSCDGLPLIGALADFPGIHLLAGFAGRTQNFMFEVAEQLARGILKEGPSDAVNYFSTKRFV